MKTVNTVILLGYVASELTTQNFENGTHCTQFALKTRDQHGKGDAMKIEKNFHNLIAWGSVANNLTTLLNRGDIVSVIGRLKNKKIEDKNGGKPIFKTEVVVSEWSKVADAPTEENND